jgi:hypothetical protein
MQIKGDSNKKNCLWLLNYGASCGVVVATSEIQSSVINVKIFNEFFQRTSNFTSVAPNNEEFGRVKPDSILN